MDKQTFQQLDRIEEYNKSNWIMLDYLTRVFKMRFPDTHKAILEEVKKESEVKKG